MSRTISVHVRCTFLCRPLHKYNVKWPNSASSEERELWRLITLTMINDVNYLRVSRNSLVKYKFIFNRRCLRRRRGSFLSSLLSVPRIELFSKSVSRRKLWEYVRVYFCAKWWLLCLLSLKYFLQHAQFYKLRNITSSVIPPTPH